MDGDMVGQECVEFINAFTLQDDRTACGVAMFEGVFGRDFLSLGGFGAVRFGPVDSGGFGLQV